MQLFHSLQRVKYFDQNTLLVIIKLSSYLETYFDTQPEHQVKFAVNHTRVIPAESLLYFNGQNVFKNCHGPRCCSRVSISVFGGSEWG
jgi:hypothetical protein